MTLKSIRNVQQISASTRDMTATSSGVSPVTDETGAAADVQEIAGGVARPSGHLSVGTGAFIAGVRAD